MVSSASLKGKILINWCFFCRNRGSWNFLDKKWCTIIFMIISLSCVSVVVFLLLERVRVVWLFTIHRSFPKNGIKSDEIRETIYFLKFRMVISVYLYFRLFVNKLSKSYTSFNNQFRVSICLMRIIFVFFQLIIVNTFLCIMNICFINCWKSV